MFRYLGVFLSSKIATKINFVTFYHYDPHQHYLNGNNKLELGGIKLPDGRVYKEVLWTLVCVCINLYLHNGTNSQTGL